MHEEEYAKALDKAVEDNFRKGVDKAIAENDMEKLYTGMYQLMTNARHKYWFAYEECEWMKIVDGGPEMLKGRLDKLSPAELKQFSNGVLEDMGRFEYEHRQLDRSIKNRTNCLSLVKPAICFAIATFRQFGDNFLFNNRILDFVIFYFGVALIFVILTGLGFLPKSAMENEIETKRSSRIR